MTPTIYNVKNQRSVNLVGWMRDEIIAQMLRDDEPGLLSDIHSIREMGDLGAFGRIDSNVSHAMSHEKIRELTNHNDGKWVEAVQKIAWGRRGDAWCVFSGQVSTAIAEALTGYASVLPLAGACVTMRKITTAKYPQLIITDYRKLLEGDKIVYIHPSSGNGHYATFRRYELVTPDLSGCVVENDEGNTTAGFAGDKIVREGGGQYCTHRPLLGIGDMKLKMVIRPSLGLKRIT